jgi:hypothetical protein
MIGGFILLLVLFLLTQPILNGFDRKFRFFDKKLMNQLFWYHYVFVVIYYIYALLNPSDSKAYFQGAQLDYKSWFEAYGTSTVFVDFTAYPFVNWFGFNYEMMMVLFGWFGYLGFLYAYVFFRENIPVKITVFKRFDFLWLILFLPNMHFWTASLGKGSYIFMSIMMFTYAVTKLKKRIPIAILGAFITYMIRPHVMLFVAVGVVLGYMSGREKIPFFQKFLVFVVMIGGAFLAKDQILGVAGLDASGNVVENFQQFSEERSASLGASGSGVDMQSYSLPVQLFTFWFRPLFFDAPSALGLVVSAENLIYLFLFFKILKKDFIGFIRRSSVVVKMSAVIFLLTSFAMTFVMSNLGIIMRQKSMVIYFLFFVIYYYLAEKKYNKLKKLEQQRKKQAEGLVQTG